MLKTVLALAAAGSALAIAAPASAQYYPQGYNGYGYNGYGYNGYGNFGQVRVLQARIDRVERQIRFLDRRDVIRDDRADRLRYEAQNLERRLHFAARNGLNPYEANEINVRIARLEQRVQFAANGYGRYGYGRDRDGDRDDRWGRERDDD